MEVEGGIANVGEEAMEGGNRRQGEEGVRKSGSSGQGSKRSMQGKLKPWLQSWALGAGKEDMGEVGAELTHHPCALLA